MLYATRDGRDTVVWSLEEVVRVIGSTDELMKLAAVVKAQFPGAVVEAVKQSPTDPLDRLRDSKGGFDDPIPF